MASDAGFVALNAEIAKLRALRTIARDVAPAVSHALDVELRANIAAGRGPDGETWAPTLTGTRPLQNAGSALDVRAIGNTIVATLNGPTAMHHLGTARGHVQRRILPTRRIPAPVVAAIRAVIAEALPWR